MSMSPLFLAVFTTDRMLFPKLLVLSQLFLYWSTNDISTQVSLVLVIFLLILDSNTAAISHRAEHLRRLTELVNWIIMFSLWFTFLRKTQDKDGFQVDSEAYDHRLSPTAALDNGDPVKVFGTLRFFAPHHELITSAASVTQSHFFGSILLSSSG